MPSREFSRWWFAGLFAGLAALLAISTWSCLPRSSDDDDETQCPEHQEFTTYKGRTACRTRCVVDDACPRDRHCVEGVCVLRPTSADADAATDTGAPEIDTGACSADAALTIYKGVTKCRAYCESDDECPGALECEDGHCIDRSLDTGIPDTGGGDTGDVGDTEMDTGPEVTPGSLSCQEIIRCQQACSTSTCRTNVEQEGSIDGTNNYNAYLTCIQNNCPQQDQTCIDRQCSTEQMACFPDVTGQQNLSCSEFFLCLNGCSQGNTQCENDCRSRTTQVGTSQYDAILQCIRNECPNFTDSCITGAISGACSMEWKSCFNCP